LTPQTAHAETVIKQRTHITRMRNTTRQRTSHSRSSKNRWLAHK